MRKNISNTHPPINVKHGIIIRADLHTVSDVHAPVWNGAEIRKKLLLLHGEGIVLRDLRDDTVALIASVNTRADQTPLRRDGFELLGTRYYGNALIIPDEGCESPRISPEHIAHVICFFHQEENAQVADDDRRTQFPSQFEAPALM